MKRAKKIRKPVTASDLMNELSHDPDFVRRRQEVNSQFESLADRFRQEEEPLVAALNDVVGVSVKSVWDLVNNTREYRHAIPVLVAHLKYRYPYRIREGIARALTVKYAGETAYRALVKQFKDVPHSADAAEQGFKWALGNAISVVADKTHFDEVVALIRDRHHGASRDMMVLRLADLDQQRATDVLIELLGDDEVVGQAVTALGKVKAQNARSQIERLMQHPNPGIRKEASKVLAKLNK